MAWFLPSLALLWLGAANDDPLRQRMTQSKAPWSFGCDTQTIFNKENRIVCRGHVWAQRDDLKLKCDTFEAFRDDKGEMRRLICADNVLISSKEGTSKSEKAEWMGDSQTLVLSGKPVVTQGESVIAGDVIVYDLKNDRFTIKRVRGKVAPQSGAPTTQRPPKTAPK